MQFFSPTNVLALDWGTAFTRIWSNDGQKTPASARDGMRLDTSTPRWMDATVLAVEQSTNKVVAIGREAAVMEGRVTSGVKVMRPLQYGRVFDRETAKSFLQLAWQQALRSRIWWQPIVAVSVPVAATALDRMVLGEVIEETGAQEVLSVTQPLAAAIGAGVPVADASGSFIVQLGYESVDAAIISLGTLVNAQSSWHAGKWLTQEIVECLRHDFSLLISKQTAEQLLINVVSLDEHANRESLVMGQDVMSHSPRELMIRSEDLAHVVKAWSEQIIELVQQLLAAVPPELTSDVIDKGILLSGGLSQVHGLEQCMMTRLGTPVSVVDDPELAVVRGLTTIVQHVQEYQRSLAYVTTQVY